MPPPPGIADHYKKLMEAYGLNPEMVMATSDGTFFQPQNIGEDEVNALPLIVEGEQADLNFQHVIARGGMGEVVAARQPSVRRGVAVKRALHGDTRAASHLIVEGRVTGALSHPNIIPIYALGRSAAGEVLLVMKRVEGRAWSDLLRARSSLADDLNRHIEILIDVCHAVGFAHRQHVLHRDLKPANVMVGEHEEVYVLDWGIAVGLTAAAPKGIPRLDEVVPLTGTPGFLAPEMTRKDVDLSPQTDIFLLGGILHVILTGHPPQHAETIEDLIKRAATPGPLEFPDDAPEELVGICRRALDISPQNRPESAGALVEMLKTFLQHRGARDLILVTNRHLESLTRRFDETSQDVDHADVDRLFGEARFGFRQALRMWPTSEEAQRGLRLTLTKMAAFEIEAGRAESAALLLKELETHEADAARPSSRPHELWAALESLQMKRQSEAQTLEKYRQAAQDQDARIGQNWRGRAMLMVVLFYVVAASVLVALTRTGMVIDTKVMTGLHVAQLVFAIWPIVLIQRKTRPTVVGQSVVRTFLFVLAVLPVMWGAMWALDGSVVLGLCVAQLLIGGAGFAMTGVDNRFRESTWVLLVGAVFIAAVPRIALVVNGVSVLLAFVLLAWRNRKADPTAEQVDQAALGEPERP